MGSVREQKKLKAKIVLEKRAESPPSTACVVGLWLLRGVPC